MMALNVGAILSCCLHGQLQNGFVSGTCDFVIFRLLVVHEAEDAANSKGRRRRLMMKGPVGCRTPPRQSTQRYDEFRRRGEEDL